MTIETLRSFPASFEVPASLFPRRLTFRRFPEALERVPEDKGDDRDGEDDPADDKGCSGPRFCAVRVRWFCLPYGAIYTRADGKTSVFLCPGFWA